METSPVPTTASAPAPAPAATPASRVEEGSSSSSSSSSGGGGNKHNNVPSASARPSLTRQQLKQQRKAAAAVATPKQQSLTRQQLTDVVQAMQEPDDRKKTQRLKELLMDALKSRNGLSSLVTDHQALLKAKVAELTQSNKVRDTLDKLCNTLQAQNADALARAETAARVQEAHNVESNAKFQSIVDDVSSKIEEHGDLTQKNLTAQSELLQLRERLRLTEAHHSKLAETMSIELKLAVAKGDERARALEMELQTLKLRDSLEAKLGEENKILRETVQVYKTRFDEVVSSLETSGKLMQSMREESARLSKRCASLLAERGDAQKRLATATAHNKVEAKGARSVAAKQNAQIDKLKALCRDLKGKLDKASAAASATEATK